MGLLSRILGIRPRPAKLSVVVHEAHGGAIRIFETPRGEGWGWQEDAREGDGFTVMVLKYVLAATPTPLVLLAKIYTHHPATAPEPKAPNWREALGGLFSSVATVDARETTQTTMSSSLLAWEAVIDGVGAEPATPLRIRERRSMLGRELFIVTAMGPPALFAANAQDVDNWFESAAFVPVEDAK
jgi:hypothetical protein